MNRLFRNRRIQSSRFSFFRNLRCEPLEDRRMLTAAPMLVDLQPGSDSGLYDDDNLTNVTTPTIDITATESGDTVRVYREGVLLGEATQIDGTAYQYAFTSDQLAEGENSITARTFDGVEESGDSPVLVVTFDVTGPRIIANTPDGLVNLRTETLDSLTITFSEPIDFAPTGGTLTTDDVSITGPGGSVTATGVTHTAGDIYDITFAAQSQRGEYTVSIGPDIADLAGNLMDQDQDGAAGEAGQDSHTFTRDAIDADIIFTSSTTISETDSSYDGQDIAVQGTTINFDGAHAFNSLHLIDGAIVSHSANTTTETHKLDLTVTGELIVDSSSSIDVSEKGYCAGYTTGNTTVGGATGYSGGSYGGLGGSYNGSSNAVYGDYADPADWGSGGVLGAGGGSVRIVADTLTLDGQVLANGRNVWGGGSGGGIYVWVSTLQGNGSIQAAGGISNYSPRGNGGGGRVAVYASDFSGFDVDSIVAPGGGSGTTHGGAGTVYLKDTDESDGTLIIDAGSEGAGWTPLGLPGQETLVISDAVVIRGENTHVTSEHADLNIDFQNTLMITQSAMLEIEGDFHLGPSVSLTLNDGGQLSVQGTLTSVVPVTVATGAALNVSEDFVPQVPVTVTESGSLVVGGNLDLGASVSLTLDNAGQLSVEGTLASGLPLIIDGGTIAAGRIEAPGVSVINAGLLTSLTSTTTQMHKLELEVAGTILVDSTSSIDASEKGYCAGYTTGNTAVGGATGYSGGSYGGLGGSYNGSSNAVYGDYADPADWGSGGVLGAGGGSVRIVADTLTLDGQVLANGRNVWGGGSGGGIYVWVSTLQGNGSIQAAGGISNYSPRGNGGGGRVAVYASDLSGFDVGSIVAPGGGSGTNHGGAGTVYLKDRNESDGTLIIDAGSEGAGWTPLGLPGQETLVISDAVVIRGENTHVMSEHADLNIDFQNTLMITQSAMLEIEGNFDLGPSVSLILNDGGQLSVQETLTSIAPVTVTTGAVLTISEAFDAQAAVSVTGSGLLEIKGTLTSIPPVTVDGGTIAGGRIEAPSVSVVNGGLLTSLTSTTTEMYKLEMDVAGTILVDSSSSIDVSEKGYRPGYTTGNTTEGGTTGNSGGSYGGLGGSYDGSPNAVYGDYTNPSDWGSGGRHAAGGGLVRIEAETLTLDGQLLADGYDYAGGGSGGGIYVSVSTLQGSGSIQAAGGDANYSNFGAGAGGRVAVYASDFSGFDIGSITAPGGINGMYPGGAGTVYVKDTDELHGTLIIDAGSNGHGWTPLGLPGQETLVISDAVVIRGENTHVTSQHADLNIEFQNTLTITQSSTLEIEGDFDLGPSVSLTLNEGGQLSVQGTLTSAVPATVTTGAVLSVSEDFVPQAAVIVTEGGTLVAGGNFNLGSSVSLTLDNGGQLSIEGTLASGLPVTVDGGTIAAGRIEAPEVSVINTGLLTSLPSTTSEMHKLEMDVAGTILVDASSSIDVSEKGYRPGYTTGNTTVGGATGDSGGSYGGWGGIGIDGVTNAVYGDYTNPSDWGSGGRHSAGGGLVRIEAETLTLNGQLLADGYSYAAAGSGGGIYVSVSTLEGRGNIQAAGGDGTGGGGRVAVYASDFSGFDIGSITAPGGTGGNPAGAGTVYVKDTDELHGTLIIDAGSNGHGWTPLGLPGQETLVISDAVVIRGESAHVTPEHADLNIEFQNTLTITQSAMLEIEGDFNLGSSATLVLNDGGQLCIDGTLTSVVPVTVTTGAVLSISEAFDAQAAVAVTESGLLEIRGTLMSIPPVTVDGGTIAAGRIEAPEVSVINTGLLTSLTSTTAEMYKLEMDVAGTLLVDASSSIDVSEKGYRPGYTTGNTTVGGATGDSGGSYGGWGGTGIDGVTNAVYGDYTNPSDWGSGGRHAAGGGLVRIEAETLTLNGQLLADGRTYAAAGSGGGIYVSVSTLQGNGNIQAAGGNGTGGGGRVAVYASDFSGFDISSITAPGGTGGNPAGAGTVYVKDTDELHGTLIIDAGSNGDGWTPLGLPGQETLVISDAVVIRGESAHVKPEHADLNIEFQNTVTIEQSARLEIGEEFSLGSSASLVLNEGGQLSVDGMLTTAVPVTVDTGAVLSVSGEYTAQAMLTVTEDASLEIAGDFHLSSSASLVLEKQGHVSVGGTMTSEVPVTVATGASMRVSRDCLTNASVTATAGGLLEVTGNLSLGESASLALDNAGQVSVEGALTASLPVTVDGGTLAAGRIEAPSVSVINTGVLTSLRSTSTQMHKLEMDIAGTILVDSTSRIDVSEKGYRAHTTTGNTTEGGATGRSGGSYGGLGGGSSPNAVYGDYADPDDWGSGGYVPGGGLVRIVAETLTLDGQLLSNGRDWGAAGSGGGIYVWVSTLEGTGLIQAAGGSSLEVGWDNGGGGRVAVYALDLSGFDVASITAPGGDFGSYPGGAGSVHIVEGRPHTHVRSHLPVGQNGDFVTDLYNVLLHFNNPIDIDAFTPADISIDGPLGSVVATNLTALDEQIYRIDFPVPTENGYYHFTVLPTLVDFEGYPLDQNANGAPGEPGDFYTFTLILDTVAPRVTNHTPAGDITGTIDHVDIWFSEAIDKTTFTTSDVTITLPTGSTISATSLQEVGLNRFRVGFAPQTTEGVYHVDLGPDITDLAGNLLDQDGDGVLGEPDEDIYEATFHYVDVDLEISCVTVSDELWAGEPITVSWNGQNASGAPLLGNWVDAVYLSVDDQWDFKDILLTTIEHKDGLNENEPYVQSTIVYPPGVMPGDYYLLVRGDVLNQERESAGEANNLAVAGPFPLDIRALATSDAPVTSSLTTEDRYDWFRVEVSAGEHLRIVLDDANDLGSNSLYVRYGQPATRTEYHYRHTGTSEADRQIDIPDTVSGVYYVMVYANSLPDDSGDYSISATTPGFEIHEVTPLVVGNGGSVTLTVHGSQIPPDVVPVLVSPSGARFEANSVYRHAAGTVCPCFDLTGAEPGAYDVRLETTDGTCAEMSGAITINESSLSTNEISVLVPETRITVPRIVRSGLQFDVLVEYWNPYDVDIPVPLLQISGSEGAHLSFNNRTLSTGSLHVLGLSESGPTDLLPPGSSGQIWIKSQAGPDALNYYVDVVPADDETIVWGELKDVMRPDDINVVEWDIAWPVFLEQVGDTWADYYQMLVRNAGLFPESMGDSRDAVDLLELEIRKAVAAIGTSIAGIGVPTDSSVDPTGREIIAHNLETGEQFFTTSLNDGSFLFDRVSPGTYTFTFYGAIISLGSEASVVDGQTLTGVQLGLGPGAEILGQVRDSVTREALADTRVIAIGEDYSEIATITDDEGQYLLEGLPSGTYTLFTEPDGMVREVVQELVIESHHDVLVVDLDIEPESVIVAEVSLEAGGPSDETLEISAQLMNDIEGVGYFFASPDEASFAIENLPAGTYRVNIGCMGYQNLELTDISVAQGETLDLGILNLELAASLTGSVVSNDANTSAEGMAVGLFLDGQQLSVTLADSSGGFTFDRLGPGKYTVRAIGVAYEEFGPAKTITLEKGDDATGLEITVLAGASIRGTVSDAITSTPLANVPVILAGPNDLLISTATDANGEYVFDALGLGDHRVAIPVTGSNASQLVTLTDMDGRLYFADLAFERSARLSGTLTLSDGSVPTGGGVALYEGDQYIVSAMADENGEYWFEFVREGTFELRPFATDGTYEAITDVVISPGTDIVQDFVAGDASLTVTVTDAAGSVEGLLLFVSRHFEDDELIAVLELPASGVESLPDLAPGEYIVEVLGAEHRYGRAATNVSESTTISLTVELAEAHVLSGIITDGAGMPIASAVITLIPTDDAGRKTIGITDADGRYEITGLPAGTYGVVISADGHKPRIHGGVTVAGDSCLDDALSPATAQVAGRIVDINGVPITGAIITVVDTEQHTVGVAVSNFDGSFQTAVPVSDNLAIKVAAQSFASRELGSMDIAPGINSLGVLSLTSVALPSTLGEAANVAKESGIDHLDDTGADAASDQEKDNTVSVFPQWIEILLDIASSRLNEVSNPPEPPREFYDPCGSRLKCVELYKALLKVIPKQEKAWLLFMEEFSKLDKAALRAEILWVDFAVDAAIVVKTFVDKTPVGTIRRLNPYGIPLDLVLYGLDKGTDLFKKALEDVEEASSQPFWQEAAGIVGEAGGKVGAAVGWLGKAVELLRERLPFLPPELFSRISKALSALDLAISIADGGAKKALSGLSSTFGPVVTASKRAYAARLTYESVVDRAKLLDAEYRECCESAKSKTPSRGTSRSGGDGSTVSDNHCVSWDPNDKIGPSGYGQAGFVFADASMPFTVFFENDPEKATGPAQEVRILDQLDDDLDLTTFALTEIAFANHIIEVPSGCEYFETTVDLRPDGIEAIVEIEAGVDLETRQFYATFRAIDPVWGWRPEDPLIGLLYPNDENGSGEGHVSYVVKPLEGLPSGTVIENRAEIIFDYNDPIETPLVHNTLDAGMPTSQIVIIPEVTSSTEITLQWTGDDEPGGSGIASYDIFASIDGGDYFVLLDDVTGTSALIPVEPGRTYAFYSIATDNVGHRESPPAEADTTTTIVVPSVRISPSGSLITTEGGHEVELSIVLTGPPSDDVVISIESSDMTEGSVSTDELTFTTENWGTPQTVTVTGQNDAIGDGDVSYTVVIGPLASTDANYDGMDPDDLKFANEDDDVSAAYVADISVATAMGGAFDIVFSEPMDVGEMIADGSIVSAVSIVDLAGESLPLTAEQFTYEPETRTLSWTPDDVLPDGYYKLRLDGSQFVDTAGNVLRGGSGGLNYPVQEFNAAQLVQTAETYLWVDSYSVPSLGDWNADGLLDLLIGEETSTGEGKVRVYLNSGTELAPLYDDYFYAQMTGGTDVTVPAGGCLGTFPRLFDWDQDGKEDLFIGLADGRIQFWPNEGTAADPQFGTPTYLQVGETGSKTDIDLGDRATLDIVDWNNDGRHDLVAGGLDGRVHLFLNEAPTGPADFQEDLLLESAGAELTVPTGRASVAVADLNGDGRKDLIAGNTEGQLWLYLNEGSDAAPELGPGQLLQAAGLDIDLPGIPRSRPFIGDFDGDGAVDLLVGAQDGLVRFYKGEPTSPVPVPLVNDGVTGAEVVYTYALTLDTIPPSSHILTLPPSTNTEFTLEWTGEDESGGSGIAHYDIYYAVDDGLFVRWMNDTTQTSAPFPGRSPHTYYFYSVTTDNMGNTEPAPAVPDAQITVISDQPGDLDGDGYVCGSDREIIDNHLGQTCTPGDLAFGDLSGDGVIDEADIGILDTYWLQGTPPLPGDMNNDGYVGVSGTIGSADLDIVRANWGQSVFPTNYRRGDASGDGFVGSADLDIVRANWGAGEPPEAASATEAPSDADASSKTPTTPTDRVYGPQRKSASDAAFSSWEDSARDHSLSDTDLAALAEAAWLREVEGLRSKGKQKSVQRDALNELLFAGE